MHNKSRSGFGDGPKLDGKNELDLWWKSCGPLACEGIGDT